MTETILMWRAATLLFPAVYRVTFEFAVVDHISLHECNIFVIFKIIRVCLSSCLTTFGAFCAHSIFRLIRKRLTPSLQLQTEFFDNTIRKLVAILPQLDNTWVRNV